MKVGPGLVCWLLVLLWCAQVLAQDVGPARVDESAPAGATEPIPSAKTPAPPPSAPEQAPGTTGVEPVSECVPACRGGFTCHAGRCISACNPPCPAGQQCVGDGRCDIPLPGSSDSVFEPPPPLERTFEQLHFNMISFRLGFAGKMNQSLDLSGDPPAKSDTSSDLAYTYGLTLRGDVPAHRYFLVGPLLQFGAWRAEDADKRNLAFDLDFYPRLRIPATGDSTNGQVWAGMPIGLSLNYQHVSDLHDPVGLGWNFGALFGGAVHLSRKFGLFTELGWTQHRYPHSGKTFTNDAVMPPREESRRTLDLRVSQWNWNIGIVWKN